ncbi:MAG: hypothetical protein ACRDWA_06970 [Acidimicrobiia bacterium]
MLQIEDLHKSYGRVNALNGCSFAAVPSRMLGFLGPNGVGAGLHLVGAETEIPSAHELLAPTLVRSQTLSTLNEAVFRDEIPADVARERLRRIGRMPIRLLGDAVLRRRAWELADQIGWASTYIAEYVALTQLQADAFITLDTDLARSVKGIVTTASIVALS